MTQTYPTSGYRTAAAARAGFQSFEQRFLSQPVRLRGERRDRDAELFQDILRQAFKPSSPGTPIRTGPGESRIPKIRASALHLGSAAIRRHPVYRAAELAWEAHQFLSQPVSVQTEEEDPAGALTAAGWSACVQCRSDPSHQQYDTSSNCALTKCYSNQWATTNGAYGDPIPSTTRRLTLWTYQWWDSFGRYSVASEWVRPSTGAMPENWHIVTTGHLQLVPQQMPMPVPYRLAPHRPNSSEREAGYSTATGSRSSPPIDGRGNDLTHGQERPPGPDQSEGKWSVMSGGKLRNFVEMAFEGIEQVGIFHDALPQDCKAPPGATAAQQFLAVFACAPRLDVCKIIEGQINNHIEDKIVGAIGQAAKLSAQKTGKAYGLSGITKRLGKPYFDDDMNLQFDPTLPFSIPKVSICG